MSTQWLFDVIQNRRDNPSEGSYTSSLFAEGLPKIAQKVGEEASEVIVAALAASLFHDGKLNILDLKNQLSDWGLPVRLALEAK